MSVITISREIGSQGGDIAEKTAQALGYHLADKQVIGNVLKQYGIVEFDQEYDTALSFWERFDARRVERRDVMLSMLHQVVQALAQHGNVVIVGRGSFAPLAGYTNVLNVRIQAPSSSRARRVREQQGLATIEEAEAVVAEADKVRAGFIESVYGAKWDTASAFDVVIDTSKVLPELATRWLVEAAQALDRATWSSGPTTAALEVDPILAAAVSTELKCAALHT